MKICNNISCMKQILSTHNPKVVSSNLAPATKWKRTFKQVKQLENKTVGLDYRFFVKSNILIETQQINAA